MKRRANLWSHNEWEGTKNEVDKNRTWVELIIVCGDINLWLCTGPAIPIPIPKTLPFFNVARNFLAVETRESKRRNYVMSSSKNVEKIVNPRTEGSPYKNLFVTL